ncbi:MAG TPA: TolC family protein [Rhodanobacteraceae bacterium]|nr:TolC family protein [Rhodanobacteraceae bacterium]
MRVIRTVPWGAVAVLWALGTTAAELKSPLVAINAADVAPPALQAALQSVWRTSPEVIAAGAERDAARARAAAAARPLYNPEIELAAENADVKTRTVGLRLALDVSGKRRARAAQGEAASQAAEARYALARRALATRWLGAWSAAALAAQQQALGETQLGLMQRFDRLAAERLAVGDISRPERELAALALAEHRMQQAALLGDAAAARAALTVIGGVPMASLPALPTGLPPASSAYAARAAESTLPLAEARAEQARADAGVEVARRARVPDPSLSLVGGRVQSGPLTDQVIGVTLSIPLPILDNGSASVTAAEAEANAAAARVRVAEQSVRAAVLEAEARYDALRAALVSIRHGPADTFAPRAALLEKLWRAGEIDTADYLVQLKQGLDTRLSALQLESRMWQAWFDYLAAAGRLSDWVDGTLPETH